MKSLAIKVQGDRDSSSESKAGWMFVISGDVQSQARLDLLEYYTLRVAGCSAKSPHLKERKHEHIATANESAVARSTIERP